MRVEGRPQRKHPRLKNYDYSRDGSYFVTLGRADRRRDLSTVSVGRGLAPAAVALTELGSFLEEQLLALPGRYPFLSVDRYVFMPDHLHVLLTFSGDAAGASPRPTERRPDLMAAVGAYKSLTTRLWNLRRGTPGERLWQGSFYEEVVSTLAYYRTIWNYIDANPQRWADRMR